MRRDLLAGRCLLAWMLAMVIGACSGTVGSDGDAGADGSAQEDAGTDGGWQDTGADDAGQEDAGSRDAGADDGALEDGGAEGGDLPPPPDAEAVPTFHCVGLTWAPAGGAADRACRVRYRLFADSAWREALPLWFDARDGEYRGSIVQLEPESRYQIELELAGTAQRTALVVDTWSESFPIGETVYLPESASEALVISGGGSPEGYTLYTHEPGKTAAIDVGGSARADIEIEDGAAYAIIRGLTLRAGDEHGIFFRGAAHDIVIEECDISGWGHDEQGGGAIESGQVARLVIQRNRIHHPRGTAQSWDLGHPAGPSAIRLHDSPGNQVIRYNEMYSELGHYYQDALTGSSNDSPNGNPGRDSDIYANYVANCWDDGIQAEGGGRNVRIWGNFIEHTKTHIAIAPVSVGPTYIWRNTGGEMRRSHLQELSDDWNRGPYIKTGGETQWNGGRVYVFHNTDLNPAPTQPDQVLRLGARGGIKSEGGQTFEHIGWNNVFTHFTRGTVFSDNANSCTNELDHDMVYGRYDENDCAFRPHESNGIELQGETWWDYLDLSAQIAFDYEAASGTGTTVGYYPLNASCGGIDAGRVIPNFNDGYQGAGPDIGAFEAGGPPLEYGVDAYRERSSP
ncbi:MAG: right-handed parallel beta-helix repeat-containing protein [Deltaproteobacteria bacterium]|nr:right-handed parallel beta-helix repeat-containing protein [Deltaproteobacteria bacterium]